MINFDRLEPVDNNKLIFINWGFGNICNYACSYCPSKCHDGSIKWPELENVNTFVRYCTEKFNRKIFFELLGGEITVWKDFPKFCDTTKEQGHKIGLVSNGSRTIRWWKENIKYIDKLVLSFHTQYADISKFYEIADFATQNCMVSISLMMYDNEPYWTKAKEAAEKLNEIDNLCVNLKLLRVYPSKKLHNYNDTKITFVNEFNERTGRKHIVTTNRIINDMKISNSNEEEIVDNITNIIVQGKNRFTGWSCDTGISQFFISFDGTIKRGVCGIGGPIGNINEPEKISWPTSSIICNKYSCWCEFDLFAKKVKNG